MQRVKCPAAGCVYQADPISTFEHERTSASCRNDVCPGKTCNFQGKRNEVLAHALACSNVFLNCRSCRFPIRFINHRTHSCRKVESNLEFLIGKSIRRNYAGYIAKTAVSADEVIDEHERDQRGRSSPSLRERIETAMREFATVATIQNGQRDNILREMDEVNAITQEGRGRRRRVEPDTVAAVVPALVRRRVEPEPASAPVVPASAPVVVLVSDPDSQPTYVVEIDYVGGTLQSTPPAQPPTLPVALVRPRRTSTRRRNIFDL